MLWNATESICIADGAIKNQARVSSLCCNYVKFPDCRASRPSGFSGFSAALQCCNMAGLDFLFHEDLEQCWVSLCPGPVACAMRELRALLPVVTGGELFKNSCQDPLFEQRRQRTVWILDMLCHCLEEAESERLAGADMQRRVCRHRRNGVVAANLGQRQLLVLAEKVRLRPRSQVLQSLLYHVVRLEPGHEAPGQALKASWSGGAMICSAIEACTVTELESARDKVFGDEVREIGNAGTVMALP